MTLLWCIAGGGRQSSKGTTNIDANMKCVRKYSSHFIYWQSKARKPPADGAFQLFPSIHPYIVHRPRPNMGLYVRLNMGPHPQINLCGEWRWRCHSLCTFNVVTRGPPAFQTSLYFTCVRDRLAAAEMLSFYKYSTYLGGLGLGWRKICSLLVDKDTLTCKISLFFRVNQLFARSSQRGLLLLRPSVGASSLFNTDQKAAMGKLS